MPSIFVTHMITDSQSVETMAFECLVKRGYSTISAEGLVSPAFPDTFAPSAFHARIVSGAKFGPDSGANTGLAGSQWVYRHIDQEKVGSSTFHLSCFKMLVFFTVHTPILDDREIRHESIVTFAGLLRGIGVRSEKCLITYFGGGKIRGQGFDADDEVVELWTAIGVPRENLIPVGGDSNFTNVLRRGEPAGPRCEVFWPISNGSFVEVGTVSFEKYLLEGRKLDLSASKGLVYGGAVGLERMAMIASGLHDVFSIPELRSLVNLVEGGIDGRLSRVCAAQVRQLVDAVRTLSILAIEVGEVGEGRRAERIHRLGGIVRRCMRALGIEDGRNLVRGLVEAIILQGNVTTGVAVSKLIDIVIQSVQLV